MDNPIDRFFSDDNDRLVVFYVKLGSLWDDDYKFETALRLLPFDAQTKIISKKFSKDAHTALANQLLQRYICCLLLNTKDMSFVKFTRNEYGKPSLENSNGLSFSMSNQQGYTSMVVCKSGVDVGIDLASTRDVAQFGEENFIAHFRDIFHPNELEQLRSVSGKEELKNVFTHYWALKESYTKKLGVGLNGDLPSYSFFGVGALEPTRPPHMETSSLMERNDVNWENSVSLRVYDNAENIGIFSSMIDEHVVVSVCRDGHATIPPILVEVPLELIVSFFS